MKFRLKAFRLHLTGSATVLTLVLGSLYLGWYHWPGWYLVGVGPVVLVMGGVDLALGPLLTLIIANPGKPRRELKRDIGIIVAVQLAALIYGSVSLWNGRPLYYAFSVSVLQVVQAYDLEPQDSAAARERNLPLAPHWHSLPRWIWAPLPEDPQASADIIGGVLTGGADVNEMPTHYQDWQKGVPALREQLKPVAKVAYFSGKQKDALKDKLSAAGLPVDQANSIPLSGRGRPLLAVFDPASMKFLGYFSAD
jgi:hypothetical protein